MSPIITSSSQSRTVEKRQPAKMALDFAQASSEDRQSKTPISWEPPVAWASTIEQDPENLPRPSAIQTTSMLESENEVCQRSTSLGDQYSYAYSSAECASMFEADP